MLRSAGILAYRRQPELEVFLVHPGGPFWKNKDSGSWSIPKGEYEAGEEPFKAATREFYEETGIRITGNFMPLTSIRQKSGKWVDAWCVESDFDASVVRSNLITIEWPPKTGRKLEIPEVDKGGWFTINIAKEKINPAQSLLIDELVRLLTS